MSLAGKESVCDEAIGIHCQMWRSSAGFAAVSDVSVEACKPGGLPFMFLGA